MIQIIKAKRINLGNIEELFLTYEPVVLNIASKISRALYFLPDHITTELVHEARFSLIKTLNRYNKKYCGTFRRPVALKTEIVWKCYSDLSDWWSRTYVGYKRWESQKANHAFPISKEAMEISLNCTLEPFSDAPDASHEVIDAEEREVSRSVLFDYQKRLKLNNTQIDALLLSFSEFNIKHPRMLTPKGHDNLKQMIRKRMLELFNMDRAKQGNNDENRENNDMNKTLDKRPVTELLLVNSCCGDGMKLVTKYISQHPWLKTSLKKYGIFQVRDLKLDKKYGFSLKSLEGSGKAKLIVGGKIVAEIV